MKDERKTFETWAGAKATPGWLVAAARALRGWAIGREVTEAEFDDAIHAAGSVTIGHDQTR